MQSSGIPAGGWPTSSCTAGLQSALSSAQGWTHLLQPGRGLHSILSLIYAHQLCNRLSQVHNWLPEASRRFQELPALSVSCELGDFSKAHKAPVLLVALACTVTVRLFLCHGELMMFVRIGRSAARCLSLPLHLGHLAAQVICHLIHALYTHFVHLSWTSSLACYSCIRSSSPTPKPLRP